MSAVSRELRSGWDACPRKPNDAMGTICVPPAANQLRLLDNGGPPLNRTQQGLPLKKGRDNDTRLQAPRHDHPIRRVRRAERPSRYNPEWGSTEIADTGARRIRKEGQQRPVLSGSFSELPLRSLGLPIPFQAEYEGSIPFARRPEVMLALRRAKSSIANDGLAPTPGRPTAYTRTKIASSVISTVNCPFSIRSPTE